MEKLLSIITVCYNSEDTIRKCIDSIVSQYDSRIEYILVDGLSSDSTVSIIEEYKKENEYIKYVSEKDDGIYDAMNKGIKLSNGKWILFINSDDCLIDGKLKILLDNLEINDSFDCVYSDIEEVYFYNNVEYKRIYNTTSNINEIEHEMVIRHQAFICKRQKMLDIGCFDLQYKIAADWDSIIRLKKNGAKFKKLNLVFSKFYLGGASAKNHAKERHAIRKNNACYKIIDIKYFVDLFHSLNLRRKINKILGSKNVTENWIKAMGLKSD